MELLFGKTKEFLENGVKKRLNVLITGTDEKKKMEVMNELIKNVEKWERLGVISTRNEFIINQPHVFYMQVQPNVSAKDIAKGLLRMSPTRILCDNVKKCSLEILQAMNTGHDGTIGMAEDLEEVITGVGNSGFELPLNFIYSLIGDTVDIEIEIKNNDITIHQILYKKEDNKIKKETLFELNNGEEIVHNVELKKSIKEKYGHYEEWKQRTEDEKKRKPKTGYIKEINYDEFFKLFKEKYQFKKMNELKTVLNETVSVVRELQEDETIPVGASKFGGNPDLPKGTDYPYYNDNIAYTFIMQINCEEYSKYEKENRLPKTGMLYFFHLIEDDEIMMPYDYEGKEGYETYLKASKIFYHAGDSSTLERMELPNNQHIEKIKSAKIHFVRSLTIKKPFENEEYYKQNEFDVNTDKENEESMKDLKTALTRLVYEKPQETLNGELNHFYDRPFHQLFGEAEHYQGPPEDVIKHEMKQRFGQEEEAQKKWVLLFQLWEDKEINMRMSGGDGIIHYYIKQEDLNTLKFDSVYSTFECG